MMTVKKYCEENNLDPNKVFDMVLGESGSILPKARGFTGYIVEIKDDCLSCTNDKFNVFNKEIPFSSFQLPIHLWYFVFLPIHSYIHPLCR